MDKSFNHLVKQSIQQKKWRYELPSFLPFSKMSTYDSAQYYGESLINKDRKKTNIKKIKYRHKIKTTYQKYKTNLIFGKTQIKDGFVLGNGHGYCFFSNKAYLVSKVKRITVNNLYEEKKCYFLYRDNKSLYIGRAFGFILDGTLFIVFGKYVRQEMKKQSNKQKIKKEQQKKKRNNIQSFRYLWNRQFILNYKLHKRDYSKFYKEEIMPTNLMNSMHYVGSVRGRFIKKKTNSGRIYKRLHSVLQMNTL
jgi:hypothetical protein